jgi:Ser/Thr protein kinase RdoA (MazF antagonist)
MILNLVETEPEKYILRVYRKGWGTKEEIDFELELLAFLRERNQLAAYPIQREEKLPYEYTDYNPAANTLSL